MRRRKQRREKPFEVKRGDIFMADLGDEVDVVGSEQFGIRPVVVTQSNRQNLSSTTIIIAVITSEIKKERMNTHVILPKIEGLPKQSMVCAEQRFTIDKVRLLEYRCTLSKKIMKKVTRACHKAEQAERTRKHRYW